LKQYKSPGNDKIPTQLIQAGGETFVSAISKPINSICNNEELPDQWKKSIIEPIHKKDDKTDCNNIVGYHCYQLRTKYIEILLSRLNPYIDEITEDHQCGFSRDRSTTDQILSIL
jgi:hypothetical protein